MNWKTFLKETKVGFILTNILIAIIVASIGLTVVVIGLKNYTQHGVEITVPDITGMYIEEAEMTLTAHGLKMEVIDSTYSNKKPLGTLVEQTPSAGAKAKEGRTVYVIQNARFKRPVIVPELRDVSLRQAQASLHTLGLTVKDVLYEPSTYKDIVLDVQTAQGTPILAGNTLPEGSEVVLVIGKGQGTEQVTVPLIIGKSLTEARSWLLNEMLTLGIVEYDIPPTDEDKDQYIVYSQSPTSGTVVVEGTNVNIQMSKDIEKAITTNTEEDEEEFF